jgi:glyoxylase I family protein
MMKTGNCFIELFEWQAPGVREAEPLRPTDLGYTHFCVDVSDIESEYRRLTVLGMRFVHPEPVEAGPYKSLYGYDPEGNLIEIQEVPAGDVFSLEAADID